MTLIDFPHVLWWFMALCCGGLFVRVFSVWRNHALSQQDQMFEQRMRAHFGPVETRYPPKRAGEHSQQWRHRCKS